MNILRSFWQHLFKYDWKVGLLLILLFGISRFIIVLDINVSGSYGWVSILFMLMLITPWIFLTKYGRKQMGICKPHDFKWLFFAFVLGIAFCCVVYVCSQWLFGSSVNNSFVYISRSYHLPDKGFSTFLIFALTAMTFSPIGEELLYRGIIHGSFVGRFGEKKASLFDSLAFALTHLAHFGIIYDMGAWKFLPLPALFWILCMFLVSRIFFLSKQKSGSIFGAMSSHAGYNLAMMYFIFYHVL